MTGRTRRDLADFEWRMDRDHAETVTCPRCNAQVGQPCRNPITGDELRTPVTTPVAIGFGFLAGGLISWVWLGDWRFAVTGLALLLVAAIAGSVRRTP